MTKRAKMDQLPCPEHEFNCNFTIYVPKEMVGKIEQTDSFRVKGTVPQDEIDEYRPIFIGFRGSQSFVLGATVAFHGNFLPGDDAVTNNMGPFCPTDYWLFDSDMEAYEKMCKVTNSEEPVFHPVKYGLEVIERWIYDDMFCSVFAVRSAESFDEGYAAGMEPINLTTNTIRIIFTE